MKSNLTSANKLQCSLHLQPFSLYCDRCLQPVCQKCTFIGPHNTIIHSLIPLHQAYQRRVQQINTRLSHLSQTRQSALHKITILTNQINSLKIKYQQITVQNDKNRLQIQSNLLKNSQNILSLLSKQQQQIILYLNQINDLGHQFQTLAISSDVDCLINYQRIMQQLRQIVDKIQILLQKNIQTNQLPKQLSQIRIKLQQIQTYKQIYNKKLQVIKQLITKLQQQKQKIQSPKIQYQQMLKQINILLNRYQDNKKYGQFNTSLEKPTLKKSHFVCNFCGIIMDDYTINTVCTRNQISQQIKGTQKYGSYYSNTTTNNNNNAQINKIGYCKKQPQIVFYGTQRHYFGQPSNPNIFYRAAYLNITLGKQILSLFLSFLPQSDTILRQINQSTKSKSNSFTNYLQLLFLKIITLTKLKKYNLQKLFMKQDIKGQQKQNNIGYCQLVAMEYIFMEKIGLNQKQTGIILDICDFAQEELQKFRDSEEGKKGIVVRNYRRLVDRLNMIKV